MSEIIPAEALAYYERLHAWKNSMSGAEKINFQKFRLDALLSWWPCKIDWNFLRAAINFWSPKDHVFRFSLDELCPTHEEFCALLGIPVGASVALPVILRGYSTSLSALLRIPECEARGFIDGDRVVLPRLVDRFSAPGGDDKYQAGRAAAFALCLTTKFLLGSGHRTVDVRVIDIIKQVEAGKSIVPVVLAETLNGLDSFLEDSTTFLKGSPLLLFMWLSDHLALLEPPQVVSYQPSNYLGRKRNNHGISDEDQWIRWLSMKKSSEFRWTVPWWRVTAPIFQSPSYSCVCLCGLQKSSFYFTVRVLRQFGLPQAIPPSYGRFYGVTDLSPSVIEIIRRCWSWQGTASHSFEFAGFVQSNNLLLSDEYLDWLLEHIGEDVATVEDGLRDFVGPSFVNGMDLKKAEKDEARQAERKETPGLTKKRGRPRKTLTVEAPRDPIDDYLEGVFQRNRGQSVEGMDDDEVPLQLLADAPPKRKKSGLGKAMMK